MLSSANFSLRGCANTASWLPLIAVRISCTFTYRVVQLDLTLEVDDV